MAIMTISREVGSGGLQIGKMAAQRLGFHFADKKKIDDVFHHYGFLPFDKIYDSPTSFWDRFDNMRQLTLKNLNLAIRALAQHGNIVMVGRGSYAVLGGLDDVLNVRVQAPFKKRIKFYMETVGLTDRDEAISQLERGDSIRSAFVESTYQIAWDAAGNFDLVINTGKVSFDSAVDLLCKTLTEIDNRDVDPERSARAFSLEPYIKTAVRAALSCKETH